MGLGYDINKHGSDGKQVQQTPVDEYQYEDHVRSHPAFMVDGGQRKSSIMSYPNADGSNSYVLKTQRVVKVARPVVTRHVFVNGKPVKEDRFVGAYEDGNALKENLDTLGDINDFFNQIQMEANMPPPAAIHGRPVTTSETKPNWPTQYDDAPPRPISWGSRAAWKTPGDSQSPNSYDEPSDVRRPSNGIKPTYMSSDNGQRQDHGLSRPSWATRPSWANSRDASPPRSIVHSKQSAPNFDNWYAQNDSPISYTENFEINRPNNGRRPTYMSNGDSSPGYNPYGPSSEFSRPSWATRPTWQNSRDVSPPRSIDTKPNWNFQDDSPTGYGEHFVASRPSNVTRPTYMKNDDSPAVYSLHRPGPEMNRPSWGTRPNWPDSRDASPPRSYVHSKPSPPNSLTKPDGLAQSDSPTNVEKQLQKMSIQENRGSSPSQNKLDADKARSGSNVTKLMSHSGTAIEDPDQGYPNQSSGLIKKGNSDSPTKENSGQVKSQDDQEKPKSDGGGQIKKGENDQSPYLAEKKSATLEETAPIRPTQDLPKKVEGSYMNPSNNQHDNPDDGYSLKSKNPGNTKPNINGGWYKQPNPPQGLRGSSYGTTPITRQWNDITPNPPLDPATYTVIDSAEAKRRYGSLQPAAPTGYYGAILTSEDAVKKYGGIYIPPN